MYLIYYGEFKEGKESEFIKWLRNEDNIKKIHESSTEGMKYLETYFTINGTSKYDFEIWYEADNWAVLDKHRENKKFIAFSKQLSEETKGDPFAWMQMKVVRSSKDVRHPALDS